MHAHAHCCCLEKTEREILYCLTHKTFVYSSRQTRIQTSSCMEKYRICQLTCMKILGAYQNGKVYLYISYNNGFVKKITHYVTNCCT